MNRRFGKTHELLFILANDELLFRHSRGEGKLKQPRSQEKSTREPGILRL